MHAGIGKQHREFVGEAEFGKIESARQCPFIAEGDDLLFVASTSAPGETARRRSISAFRPHRDRAAMKIIKALAQLPLVQLDAAQIDRGGLDRAVAKQDLQHLERVDIRFDRGLCLETHEHGHGKGVPEPVQRAIKPCRSEGHSKCCRESVASYAGTVAVKE